MAQNISVSDRLAGRRVLVTGASNATGPYVARAFAQRGARLALTYHSDRAAAERVREACLALGAPDVQLHALDLLDSAACDALVADCCRSFGGLDILVAVAGAGGSYESLLTCGTRTVHDAIQGQVVGNFAIARDAGLAMPRDGSGRIIFISATSCYKNHHAAYGFAKATLNELTRFLALELASRRITVNTLVPQLIDLDSIDAALRETRKAFTPLGNIPHPEAIAEMCLVFCSPLFDIVTGQCLYMDGGYRLRPAEDR